jgi:putative SOS response-associated peptidase YedK
MLDLFALKGSPITAIAGLWREAQGNHPPTFTMLTTAPGPDVAPYHNRQVVVVRPENWSTWLELTKPEVELLWPLAPRRPPNQGGAMLKGDAVETGKAMELVAGGE